MIKQLLNILHGIMRGTRALVVQSYTEANVKNGLQFYARRTFSGSPVVNEKAGAFTSLGQKRIMYFEIGSSKVIVKDRVVKYIGEEFELRLYNATGLAAPTKAGEIMVSNYRSDGEAKPTSVTVHEVIDGDQGPMGTLIADPEAYFGSSSQGQRNADSLLEGRERVLPANSQFYVEIEMTAGTVGRFEYFLDWYEGSPDLPLKEF